jgi:hypothetical protein
MPMPGATSSLPGDPVRTFYVLSLVIVLMIVTVAGTVVLQRWSSGPRRVETRTRIRPRTLVTIGLGALWMGDGLLQAQPRLITGFVPAVLVPAAAWQPRFVQALMAGGRASGSCTRWRTTWS